ncbi:hypothetical protein [Flavobacterium reichenbachii]|uniref:Uncharacterized protein n=1 Tax=Flavobacterium reichenbachii TaxID=362418 RepID=A0A085ZJL4_9FLAO|nr:hypothetical protein [Flavobacterium reichenbachii]KFF04628.1 hypothetical protein IW19_03365 [Flavobacterium reichenbachii]OXB09823.1 hypothetical protein B0A68_23055 [Flavobacterium reichenbachii]
MKTQFKLKNTTILSFLLLLPFFAWSQIDSVNIGGTHYCSRSILDIIKRNKKNVLFFMPENFTSDSIHYNIDSSYVFINKRKYVQKVYSSKKIRFKTLNPLDKQKEFYVENLVNNKKGQLEFTEIYDLVFSGAKLKNNKLDVLLFRAKFDGYEQNFSLKFVENGLILNADHPEYRKCD